MRRRESPATRLFVQRFVHADEKNNKNTYTWVQLCSIMKNIENKSADYLHLENDWKLFRS